jgi:hypothetical protein
MIRSRLPARHPKQEVADRRPRRKRMSSPEERLVALLVAWGLVIGSTVFAWGIGGL